MITRNVQATLLATALVLGMTGNAMGNLIQNGTFDTFVPSNGTGGGWTSINIDGAGGHRTTGGNPDAMFILNDNGNPGSDPTLFQIVNGLTIGDTYRLTGDYAYAILNQGPQSNPFAVVLSASNSSSQYDFAMPGTGWGNFSIDFAPWAQNMTISFLAEINGGDTDYKVDNISLVRLGGNTGGNGSEVPEPISMLLFGSAMAVLAGSRVKRKG